MKAPPPPPHADASAADSSDGVGLYAEMLRRAAADPPRATRIRASASVIPWRPTADGIEVWWARRAPTMRFMAGFWAFPGGGLQRSDADVPLEGEPSGTAARKTTPPSPELDDDGLEEVGPDLVPGLAACALRELFEETGLLITTGQDLALPEEQKRLLEKDVSFADVVRRIPERLDVSDLVFAGRWLTPPFAPMRFDNRFFLLRWTGERDVQPSMPPIERPEHDREEWVRPADALQRWRRGEILTAPPILHVLRVLADETGTSPGERSLERLRDTKEANFGPYRQIEFRPGVFLLPLRTPTLPPATHTNAFLLGHEEMVLIDPATPLADEQERLLHALDDLRASGRRVKEIWISHHHSDHVGAVDAVRRHLAVPVLAHAASQKALRRQGIETDGALADDQVVELSGGGVHQPTLRVRVLHTPGHAPGHLAFYEEASRTLLAGDLTSTLSTIVIDPPEGDMHAYLRSLERVRDLDARILFPAHGPGHPAPSRHLEKLIAHRLEREAKVLEAWNDGLHSARAMVGRVYDDVPEELHPVAERQIEAHLGRLRKLGQID